MVEINDGRISPLTITALTEKDKVDVVDELIRAMINFCEDWKIDPAIRMMQTEKILKIEKKITEKVKARAKSKA